MERLNEIATRKAELVELLNDETKEVELEVVEKEIADLTAEETALVEAQKLADAEALAKVEAEEKAEQEQRNIAKQLENEEVEAKKIDERKEERKMEEKLFTIADVEYRNAWAKSLMGLELNKVEKKALGDAVTTTSETFVASESSVQGINNGGLFVPKEVSMAIMELILESSPFLADVKKMAVAGNIDLPYFAGGDDSEWYVELTDTKNEGMEFKKLSLTGHELAKDVEVTWKLEKMAVADFITFIEQEIAMKMGRALATAVIYGNGSGKPVGAIYNKVAVTGADPIETIINTYKSLSQDFRIGAKAYISTGVNIDIVSFKDGNDNYPLLQGLASTKLVDFVVDPYLVDGDIIVGNPNNYILNTVEAVSVARQSMVKGRKTVYGAYAIYDGKPRPNAFAKGSYTTISG